MVQTRKPGGIWCSLYSLICRETWCHLSAYSLSGNNRPLLCMSLLPPWPPHLAHTPFSSFTLNTSSSIISNNFSSKPWRLPSSCATFGCVCKNTADWEISKLPSHVTWFTVWCHTIQSGRRFATVWQVLACLGGRKLSNGRCSDIFPFCMDHLCPKHMYRELCTCVFKCVCIWVCVLLLLILRTHQDVLNVRADQESNYLQTPYVSFLQGTSSSVIYHSINPVQRDTVSMSEATDCPDNLLAPDAGVDTYMCRLSETCLISILTRSS